MMKLLHKQGSLHCFVAVCSVVTVLTGCRTPADYRQQADQAAYAIVENTRKTVSDEEGPFSIEPPALALRRRLIAAQDLPAYSAATLSTQELTPPPHWPTAALSLPQESTNSIPIHWTPDGAVELSLLDALQIAARNSREYQTAKENVFKSALALDLELNVFRSTFAGTLDSKLSADGSGSETVKGIETSLKGAAHKTLSTGAELSGLLAVDLAKLLTGDRSSALGLSADATISIPLLRGAGRHIAREPLTQAERDVLYAIYALEEFKRRLAVSVAEDFLGVMQADDSAYNAQRNFETLEASVDRARAMAEAGRLTEIQVDQTHQDQLRAYDRSVSARQSAAQALDRFKLSLGLPPDAAISLTRDAFTTLMREAEERSKEAADLLDENSVVVTALENRLDLRTAAGRVEDAQRAVVVAADALRAELSLLGSASAGSRRSLGSASEGNAEFTLSKGFLSGLIAIDLPIERTAERNAFRNQIANLERAVRDAQEKEDSIKLQVLGGLRDLIQSRESITTQLEAVRLAERRQHSTGLFLQAGRAEMRDLLEAEESLLSVRNALTAAIVNYRVAELRLQRDVGILKVTDDGMSKEQSLTVPQASATVPSAQTENPGAQDHE